VEWPESGRCDHCQPAPQRGGGKCSDWKRCHNRQPPIHLVSPIDHVLTLGAATDAVETIVLAILLANYLFLIQLLGTSALRNKWKNKAIISVDDKLM
jgi:hypothetical protein